MVQGGERSIPNPTMQSPKAHKYAAMMRPSSRPTGAFLSENRAYSLHRRKRVIRTIPDAEIALSLSPDHSTMVMHSSNGVGVNADDEADKSSQ